jgi:type II secretory pathway pseudopilin PulG
MTVRRSPHRAHGSQRLPSPRSAGFSLLETVIASAIVIAALVGLAHLLVVAIAANERARARTVATALAQEKIEELMTAGGEVADGADFIDSEGSSLGGGATAPPGAAFVRRWSTQPLPDHPAAALLQVSVTRAYGGDGDAARIVGLKTPRLPRRRRRRAP